MFEIVMREGCEGFKIDWTVLKFHLESNLVVQTLAPEQLLSGLNDFVSKLAAYLCVLST